jgi:hypothetical protein
VPAKAKNNGDVIDGRFLMVDVAFQLIADHAQTNAQF